MKFTINENTLVKALNIVSKAVTNRTTIPILKGIKLEVSEEGILTLAASDLEISITKRIDVSEDYYESGATVVQAKLFSDIIRKLPNDNLYFSDEGNNINLKCANSEFNIIGQSIDEFPNTLIEKTGEDIVFNRSIINNMIEKTTFAASIDESRGIITGCLIEMKEDKLSMVSLDGFRMAIRRENIGNKEEKNIIISAKILNEISKIINEEEEGADLTFNTSDKKAIFTIGDTNVVISLLDGEFLKYNDILPKEENIKVVLNRSDLLDAIERASLLAKVGKNNLVKIEIKDDELHVSSKSEEGNVNEKVMITKEGNDLVIGFNSKYLIDVLKTIEDSEIKLILNTPVSPLLIEPINSDNYDYLVLPVRINQGY